MLSKVPVTADQLREVIDAIGKAHPKNEDGPEFCVSAVLNLLLEDGVKEQQDLTEIGSAICIRLLGLPRC